MERVYLHSLGFDPSLFHDDDGEKMGGQHCEALPEDARSEDRPAEYDPFLKENDRALTEIFGAAG